MLSHGAGVMRTAHPYLEGGEEEEGVGQQTSRARQCTLPVENIETNGHFMGYTMYFHNCRLPVLAI